MRDPVGPDHARVAHVHDHRVGHVQPDPEHHQQHEAHHEPAGARVGHQALPARARPEAGQGEPEQQVAEQRVHERDRHAHVALVEEVLGHAEGEQHEQVEVEQAEGPPRVHERQHEEQRERQPHVPEVEGASHRGRVPAREQHRGLRSGPLLDHLAGHAVDVDVGDRRLAVVVGDLVADRMLHVVERHEDLLAHGPVLRDRLLHLRQPVGDAHGLARLHAESGRRAVTRLQADRLRLERSLLRLHGRRRGHERDASATASAARARSALRIWRAYFIGTWGRIGARPRALDRRRRRSGRPLYDRDRAPAPRAPPVRDRARAGRAGGRALSPPRRPIRAAEQEPAGPVDLDARGHGRRRRDGGALPRLRAAPARPRRRDRPRRCWWRCTCPARW